MSDRLAPGLVGDSFLQLRSNKEKRTNTINEDDFIRIIDSKCPVRPIGSSSVGDQGSRSVDISSNIFLTSSFSVARERSKVPLYGIPPFIFLESGKSFSESEPARCSPPHTPEKTSYRHASCSFAVFSTHASLLAPIPADSENFSLQHLQLLEIVGRTRRKDSIEGFSRGDPFGTISAHKHNDKIIKHYSCAEIDGMCGRD